MSLRQRPSGSISGDGVQVGGGHAAVLCLDDVVLLVGWWPDYVFENLDGGVMGWSVIDDVNEVGKQFINEFWLGRVQHSLSVSHVGYTRLGNAKQSIQVTRKQATAFAYAFELMVGNFDGLEKRHGRNLFLSKSPASPQCKRPLMSRSLNMPRQIESRTWTVIVQMLPTTPRAPNSIYQPTALSAKLRKSRR